MNWKHAFLVSCNGAICRYIPKDGFSYLAGIVTFEVGTLQKYALFSGNTRETCLRFRGPREDLQKFLKENELTRDWNPGFLHGMGMTVEEAIKKAQQ
jgi:hypothetical protein